MKKDQFNKKINIGDIVLFNNQDCHAGFLSHEYGVVIGFTKYFVIIRPDNPNNIFGVEDIEHIYRKPHRIITMENYKSKYLYLAADFENYKKSITKRIETESIRNINKILLNILGIIDDIERALENIKDEDIKTGIDLIYKKFLKLLEDNNVKKIESENSLFDPEFHEAVLTVPAKENNKGKITTIIQNGYMIKNKVLRPAKVVVAE